MELNNSYSVNIVSQPTKGRCSFVAVERFADNATEHFQNYYKALMSFNKCSDWFFKLDYPLTEIGQVVLVQTNKKNNLWARGIIYTYKFENSYPEIYFIDSQKFSDHNTYFDLRSMPPKFAELVLPTYYIDVDFYLKDDLQQRTIEMLIEQNQYGEISFSYTPGQMKNNVYCGELIVNYKNDNSFVPLKKLLKNVHKTKYFDDMPKKPQRYSVFDPLKYKYLQTIFIPREPSGILFSDISRSFSNLSDVQSSLESDELPSDLDYSCFSDDSIHTNISNHLSSIRKPQTNSWVSLSTSTSELNNSKEATSENSDENELNSLKKINTTQDTSNKMSTKSDSISSNTTQLAIKSDDSCFSDDSTHSCTPNYFDSIRKSQTNFLDSLSSSISDLSSNSIRSFENKNDTQFISITNSLNKYAYQNTEQNNSTETTSENSDENELNNVIEVNTTRDTIIEMSTQSGTINSNTMKFTIESENGVAQEKEGGSSKYTWDIKTFMKNHIRCLRKLNDTGCHQVNNSTIVNNFQVMEMPKTPILPKTEKKVTFIKYSDAELYWTDEES